MKAVNYDKKKYREMILDEAETVFDILADDTFALISS